MKRRLFALVLALCLTAMLSGCESVDDVEAAIDEIGTVTMESGSKIDSAKLKYDALSESSQAEVENADVLMDAIAEYDRLTAAVDTFIDAVGEIGFVTLDSGAAIDYAWESYEALYADNLTGYVEEYAAVLQQSEDEKALMDKLKAEGKEKSATYRQLMGNRLMYSRLLSLYREYGLLD